MLIKALFTYILCEILYTFFSQHKWANLCVKLDQGRVHFALRRTMLKPPIARLPVIELDFINRPNGEKDCIYEAHVK